MTRPIAKREELAVRLAAPNAMQEMQPPRDYAGRLDEIQRLVV